MKNGRKRIKIFKIPKRKVKITIKTKNFQKEL